MKPLHSFILGLGLALTIHAAEAPKSVARFSNNDVLTGAPESITPERLVWNSPLLGRPASFFLREVLDITLPAREPEHPADHEATLTLTNGDTIRGQLASVTGDAVSLDTWFAGRMNFNRLMVAGVKIEQSAGFVFRGPTGLDGWRQSGEKPAWTFHRAAFRSTAVGSIARTDVLPEECSVSFDAAWRGDSVRLKVIVFSDDVSTENPSSGYEVSFQRGSIHLRNCKTQSFLGSAQSQVLMENDKVHIEIRASSKSNRVALFINKQIVEVWNDPDVGKGKFGRGLHFISGSTLPLRISGIGVAPWNGVLDRMPDPQFGMGFRRGIPGMGGEDAAPADGENPSPEGRMELANGDSLTGEVLSIQDGLIAMKTPLGDIKLPVARLRTVALKPVEAERCKRFEGDVRASFPDGSSLVFRLDATTADTLTGSSQNFGSATFQLASFSRIEFNIYSPRLADLRQTEDW
ncbi:MAG: hypothetical protein Q8Q59_02195 [Luteolibacter sp.]|jgi:hypothetical protein|nr:hypothetical protein [Luteolibacter sp.]